VQTGVSPPATVIRKPARRSRENGGVGAEGGGGRVEIEERNAEMLRVFDMAKLFCGDR
jgi:hypothetical protein